MTEGRGCWKPDEVHRYLRWVEGLPEVLREGERPYEGPPVGRAPNVPRYTWDVTNPGFRREGPWEGPGGHGSGHRA